MRFHISFFKSQGSVLMILYDCFDRGKSGEKTASSVDRDVTPHQEPSTATTPLSDREVHDPEDRDGESSPLIEQLEEMLIRYVPDIYCYRYTLSCVTGSGHVNYTSTHFFTFISLLDMFK